MTFHYSPQQTAKFGGIFIVVGIVLTFIRSFHPLLFAAAMVLFGVGVLVFLIALAESAPASRKASWAGFLIITALFFFRALQSWSAESMAFPSRWMWFLFPAVFLLSVFVRRFLMGKTWTQSLDYYPEVQPRDEREEQILRRATHIAYSLSILITILFASMLAALPSFPSREGLFYLLFSLATFQLALRGVLLSAMKYGRE